MKVVKEFAENYLYYYNEIMKSNRLLLNRQENTAIFSRCVLHNDNTKEEKIKYLWKL